MFPPLRYFKCNIVTLFSIFPHRYNAFSLWQGLIIHSSTAHQVLFSFFHLPLSRYFFETIFVICCRHDSSAFFDKFITVELLDKIPVESKFESRVFFATFVLHKTIPSRIPSSAKRAEAMFNLHCFPQHLSLPPIISSKSASALFIKSETNFSSPISANSKTKYCSSNNLCMTKRL